jgi:hypothetical protein
MSLCVGHDSSVKANTGLTIVKVVYAGWTEVEVATELRVGERVCWSSRAGSSANWPTTTGPLECWRGHTRT